MASNCTFAPNGPTTTNPLAIAVAILTGLLSGDTPQSQRPQTFYHYGYASMASQFSGGLRLGSFGTSNSIIVPGTTAQQLYGLPPKDSLDSPPDAFYTVTVPPGVPVIDNGPHGPVAFPANANPTGQDVYRSGGGNEVIFPKGTPPGSVSSPGKLPGC